MTMSDERLGLAIDRAIDEVAQQMTEGQPPADFRARIVARLDAGDRPQRFWPAAWVLSPVAVAAAIVLAILVARPFKGRDLAPVRADQTVRLPPSPPSGFGGTGKPDTTYQAIKPTVQRDGARTSVRGPGSFGTGTASDLDALAPPRLEVAPLGLEVLPTESIAVRELDAIVPIAVEPLPGTDQRP
jgi:hypothetical protein